MRELLRTRDPVRLSVSAVEAGLPGFPRRLAVAEQDYARAHRVLVEAGETASDG